MQRPMLMVPPRANRALKPPAFDCVVVGGGPGGLVATLYLKRFRRSVALVTYGKARAAWIPRTYNLIGHDHGVSGRTLLRRLHHQVQRSGGVSVFRSRGRISPRPDGEFDVSLDNGTHLHARTVILATGIEDRQPELENLNLLRRRGLLRYCAICDGFEFRGTRLAVLADSDAGLQKALFLTRWASRLEIILPPELSIATRRLHELRMHRGIRLHPCRTLRLEPTRAPQGLEVFIDARRPFHVRAAYVELGCRVRDEAFAHLRGLKRTQGGFLHTTSEQRTTIPGLFAVGDCVNLLSQISVAAGQAAVAATAIHNDLL